MEQVKLETYSISKIELLKRLVRPRSSAAQSDRLGNMFALLLDDIQL